MINSKDIICVSSIDWDFIWQGHQEIMTRFARNGNRVLFIENTGVRAPRLSDLGRIKRRIINWKKGLHGVRKIENNLYVYSPIVLPFPYLRVARFVNRILIFSVLLKWLKAVGFSDPIVWTFLPTGLSLDLVNKINPKILVYYCIDSFQSSSNEAKRIKLTEEIILKKSDLVFVTSKELFKYCSKHSENVHFFPFGVNIDKFKSVMAKTRSAPSDMKDIKRPIIGYIGGIHKWIDFDIIRHAAIENKDVSFVFCGPIQTDVSLVNDLPNVFFLGQKDPDELPSYVVEFDAAMIPYKITDYTRNVYPTKLNEYLSVGKSVVSTHLPEVKRFCEENGDIVKIANDTEEFSDDIKKYTHNPLEDEARLRAMEVANKNSWSNRVEEMSALIDEVETLKMNERDIYWRRNLIKFYKNKKGLFAALLLSGVILYTVIFHTSLMWYFGNYLQVQDIPKRASAIIVLGGGVGESGLPGEGYQERVDKAVKLYKQGLSGKILYISGYKYIMKEARVMKDLSVASGINEKDVLIDDKPVNTYEMIGSIRRYSSDNKWSSIILVSSQYHMRRTKLLLDKYINDVSIYYVPVDQGDIIHKNRPVNLKQIRKIAKEYAAIIYYKLMNYI
jgi:uncharacterized SAM-binding protein YcdF (DUF218 family)